jgi:ubiquitin-conjugating enzyme E2 T
MAGPSPAMKARMKKELEMLSNDPPPGISAWLKDDLLNVLEASTKCSIIFEINCLFLAIQGPQGTPYERGTFKLEINVPDRWKQIITIGLIF